VQTFQDIYRYRFVLSALVAKELKAEYRSMALGFLWSLLNPLVMLTVLSLVLVSFFHDNWNAPSKVVVGLVPYNFFSYCLSGCSSSIVGNSSLVKRVAFPRQILPVAMILNHLVHFGIQSTLIVVTLAVFGVDQGAHVLSLNLLWLVPVFILHLGLCVGVGLLVAALNVVYRDTRYIIESSLNVLFWLSPVLYSARDAFAKPGREWMKYLYYSNPLSGVLSSYRAVLFYGTAPDLWLLAITLASTLIVGAIGVRTFWVHERRFADLIQ
jgi:lipopolysaccharide transport system permease protein